MRNLLISLVAADTIFTNKTLCAMRRCTEHFQFDNAFLFTLPDPVVPLPIIHVPIPKLKGTPGYSEFMIRYLPLYRKKFANHILVVQHDGFIINPDAWTDEFLNYDYIGGPWPDGVVGNGGFSLRSRRLLGVLSRARKEIAVTHPEDRVLCREYHTLLTREGIRFAPQEIARRFSVDNTDYQGSFGFHGVAAGRSAGVKFDFTEYNSLDRTSVD